MAEPKEAPLQLAAGAIRDRLRPCWQPEEVRLPDCAAKFSPGNAGAKVGEGASWCRNRDPTCSGDVDRLKRYRSVQENALATPPPISAGQGDVDGAISRGQQLPECRCAAMAQRGAIPQREHRSHPPPLVAWRDMADRVHTPVKLVEASGTNPAHNPRVGDPRISQLADRDSAVLAPRGSRHHRIRGALFTHAVNKSPGAEGSPLGPGGNHPGSEEPLGVAERYPSAQPRASARGFLL